MVERFISVGTGSQNHQWWPPWRTPVSSSLWFANSKCLALCWGTFRWGQRQIFWPRKSSCSSVSSLVGEGWMQQGACAEEGKQMSLLGEPSPCPRQKWHRVCNTTAHQLPLTAESRQGHPSELAGDSPTSLIVVEGGGPCYSMPKICAKNLDQYLLINVGTNFPNRASFVGKKLCVAYMNS